MGARRRALGGALAALALATGACSGGEGRRLALRLGLAPGVDGQGRCAAAPAGLPRAPGRQLRLLVLDAAPAGPPTPLCDRVVALEEGASALVLPKEAQERTLAVLAQVVDADGALVAQGQSAPFVPAAGGVVELLLAPPGRFACAAAPAARPRAFHAAATLSGGRVLLSGGLVGALDGGARVDLASGRLGATASLELFDPGAGRALPLEEVTPELALPRALHEARVLRDGTDGTALVLLFGGVRPADGVEGSPAARIGVGGEPFRIVPDESAAAAEVELLSIDLAAGRVSRVRPADGAGGRVFAAVAELTGALLVAGGAPGPAVAASDALATFSSIDDAGRGGDALPLGAGRLGASLVDEGDGLELLIGGLSAAGPLVERIDPTGARPAEAVLLAGDPIDPTAFGAVAAVGGGLDDLLLVGGFLSDGTSARQPAAAGGAFGLLRGGDGSYAARALPLPAPLVPTGYAATTSVGGARLITGGVPAFAAAPATSGCPDPAESSLFCAVAQTVRYDEATGSLVVGPVPAVARFGHSIATIDAGRALVSGGLRGRAGELEVLADLELLSADVPPGGAPIEQQACDRP